jgi:hypothetical protein
MIKFRISVGSGYRYGRAAFAVASGYAVLVLGVTGFVVWSTLTEPESFAGLWLLLVTLPLAPVAIATSSVLPHPDSPGWAHSAVKVAPFIAVGLFQAWALWRLLRGPGQTTLPTE